MSDPQFGPAPQPTKSSGTFPPLAPATPNPAGGIQLKGWDLCKLGPVILPGRTRITQGGVRLKFDHKNKKGADGALPTFHGMDPSPFQLEVMTWTNAQRENLATACKSITPQPNVDPTPLPLSHPAVLHLGSVLNVVVVGVSILHVQGSITTVTIDLLHWLPPKQKKKGAVATPTRSTPNAIAAAQAKKSNPPPTSQPANFSPNPAVGPNQSI